MQQCNQLVPIKSLLPALDEKGKQIITADGCMMFMWEGYMYEEYCPNSLTWSDYGQEWDVRLCMKPE